MSKLGVFNFVVMQWSFHRLASIRESDGRHVRWTLLGPIVPLTGWWSDYIWCRRTA